MNPATQIILSLLIVALAGWGVYRERVIERLRTQRRTLYRAGIARGREREARCWAFKRRLELINADRRADVRPDSGAPARVSQIKFHRKPDSQLP